MSAKYFCDICEEEIPHQDIREIKTKFNVDIDFKTLHICDKCYKKAIKLIVYDDSIKCRKKTLGSILKLWLGGSNNNINTITPSQSPAPKPPGRQY